MSDVEKKEILGQENELHLEELDAVAGGGEGGDDKPCACVMAGAAQSKVRDHGDPARCECVLAGYGI